MVSDSEDLANDCHIQKYLLGRLEWLNLTEQVSPSWAEERCPGQLRATQGKVKEQSQDRKGSIVPSLAAESQTLSILKRSVKQVDQQGKPGFPGDLEPRWQSLASL